MKIATYNIENFHTHFMARGLLRSATTQPVSEQVKEGLTELQRQGDEDNWESSSVILEPAFSPDILAIEECCDQDDLDYFNKRWLQGLYETVKVLPTNSGRGQNVALLMKPGFKILDQKEAYRFETDETNNPTIATNNAGKKFARGPSFYKVQTPGGQVIWVGANHQKSKSGNDIGVTKWRLGESKRTHEIIVDIAKENLPVVFVGDMNDELHLQEFEQEAGGDCIGALVGKPEDGVTLQTRKLADSGGISFGGYFRGDHRSIIDHIFTANLPPAAIKDVAIITGGLAKVSSDHYPVMMTVDFNAAK